MSTSALQRVSQRWLAYLSRLLLALRIAVMPLAIAACASTPPVASPPVASVPVSPPPGASPPASTLPAAPPPVSSLPASPPPVSPPPAAPLSVSPSPMGALQRVQFAPGASSATIKSSVVNGTRDRYLLGAQKGQTMSVRIVSLEDNAVFDVVAPSNDAVQPQTLKQEAVVWSDTLPATGDYQIVVGSTRGNASYRLQVTIR